MKRYLLLLPLLFVLVLLAVLAVGRTRKIESGLSESEAHEIIVLLRQKGIDASAEPDSTSKKEDATWQVSIKGGDEDAVRAWSLLHDHGLPREKVPGMGDIFKTPGMIPTPSEEKARMTIGLAGDLTKMLRDTPGVVDASVHVVLPDTNTLIDKKDQNATTAAVLLRYRGDRSPLTNDEIRGLVAKGVEGLTAENVNVVQIKDAETPLPPHTDGPLGGRKEEWPALSALALSALTSAGAISMLILSKQRGLRIKELERQLVQLTEGAARLEGNAKA